MLSLILILALFRGNEHLNYQSRWHGTVHNIEGQLSKAKYRSHRRVALEGVVIFALTSLVQKLLTNKTLFLSSSAANLTILAPVTSFYLA